MQRPSRIICVGNRWSPRDAAGPAVYDRLTRQALPPGVEAVDGGLLGLSLLGLVEGASRVVFVDQVEGFRPEGGLVVLDDGALFRPETPAYGHGDGLAYLVAAARAVLGESCPPMWLVGLEGAAGPENLREAAEASLRLATSREVAPAARGRS